MMPQQPEPDWYIIPDGRPSSGAYAARWDGHECIYVLHVRGLGVLTVRSEAYEPRFANHPAQPRSMALLVDHLSDSVASGGESR